MNIELQEGFIQVCVWPGTIVCDKEHTSKDFIKFMKDQFNTRIQYLEEITTNPDIDINGQIVEVLAVEMMYSLLFIRIML